MKKALGITAAILTSAALTFSALAADYANIDKINSAGGSYINSNVTSITNDISAFDTFVGGKYKSWLSKEQISVASMLNRAETGFLFDLDGDGSSEYKLSLTKENALLAYPSILEMNGNGVNLYIYMYAQPSTKRLYLIPAQDGAFGVKFNMTISANTLNTGLTAAGTSTTDALTLYYENAAGETLGTVQSLPRDANRNVSFPVEYGYTYYITAAEAALTDEELTELIDAAIQDATGLTDAELQSNTTVKDYINGVIADIASLIPDAEDINSIVEAYFANTTNLERLAQALGFADGVDGLSAYDLAKQNGYTGTLAEWLASLEGADGKSAYELAVANGYTGTLAQWLASLNGDEGQSAYELAVANGYTGTLAQWLASLSGDEGQSAYELAVANGYKGTLAQWLASLKGEDGQSFVEWATANYGSIDNFIATLKGKSAYELAYEKDKTIGTEAQWLASLQGKDGLSAYEVAVKYGGYKGTLAQWLEALQGEDGLSAYELAVKNGFKGTLTEWLESLKGEDGEDGTDGRDGTNGRDGANGTNGRDGSVVYVNSGAGSGASTGTTIIAGDTGGGTSNPKTGIVAGIVIPAASLASLLIYKKGKKRRR